MNTIKSISGLIFVVGLPLLCFSLLRNYRKNQTFIPLMGWTMFALGLLIISIASLLYLPMFIFSPPSRSAESIIFFLIWVIPSILLAYTGWTTRNKPRERP